MAEAAKNPLIMLIITKADVGGAQMHVLQIIKGLSTRFRFVLLTGEDGFLVREATELGCEVVIEPKLVRPLSPKTDLVALIRLWKHIKRFGPALVHTHSFKAGMLGRLAGLAAGSKILFTAHGWAFTPGAPRSQRIIGFLIESVLCRLCPNVITISAHDQQLAERWKVGSPARRILVLNAGHQSRLFATQASTAVKLITVGRLTAVKNQIMLLQVLSKLPSDVTLTIVGEGVQRPLLETTIQRLNIADRVELPGEVIDIEAYLAAANIFVLSSNYEGLPLSILEAMSAALPVVSTNVGGVSEAVLENVTGYLVPRGDVDSFANRLQQLIANPQLRLSQGKAAREHFTETFTEQRFLPEMEEVYRRVLKP